MCRGGGEDGGLGEEEERGGGGGGRGLMGGKVGVVLTCNIDTVLSLLPSFL